MSPEATITVSFHDYLAANRLTVRQKWSTKRVAVFLAIVSIAYTAIVAIAEMADNGFSWQLLPIALTIGLTVAITGTLGIRLYQVWYLPRIGRKMFAQQPAVSAPMQFSFDASGIRSIGPFDASTLPWSHIHAWAEDGTLLLLYRTQLSFFCLPKAQLGTPNVVALKQCLEAAGVKHGL